MSSLGLRKVFFKPYKRYRAPRARELKKVEGRKKAFFYKTEKHIGKNKMLCKVDSLMELHTQIFQIVGSLCSMDQPIQRSEASNVLYL